MKKNELRKIIKEVLEESLWDNINAKLKSGRKSARKGSKAYKAAVAAGKKLMEIEEMTSSELNSVERHADAELNPIDIEFAAPHFLQQANNKRNGKDITQDELDAFFSRLAKKKEAFIDFLKRYHELVVKDRNTSINIPFTRETDLKGMVNKAIAKTVMRTQNFGTSNKVIALEEGVDDPVKPGILKDRLGKLSCSKVRAAKAELEDKGTHYAKALQRYLNYHCQ
jgi:hypothetical protein